MTKSPVDYLESSVLAQEAGAEMLSRLEWMNLDPRVIVDVGCGPGGCVQVLQSRYPTAAILAVDSSESMLNHLKEARINGSGICADAANLPLAAESVDLVIANLMLPWHANATLLLKEWRRVLSPNGLLMFTALGPDTLTAWDTAFHRYDMHDLGDAMLQAGFADPVLDINYYTLTYREINKLLFELKASQMIAQEYAIAGDEPELEAKYEVIFAHAFTPPKTNEVTASEDGTVRIPLGSLRQRLRS